MFQVKFGTGSGPALAGLRWLERKIFEAADLVVTTNESHKRIAMERGGRPRAPSTSSAPARPGAPHRLPARPGLAQRPPPPDRLPRRDLQAGRGRPPDPGGQAPGDDHGRDDVHCVLVGGGPHQPSIKAYAEEIGVADRAPSPAG